MTHRQALLSKLLRARSRVLFQLLHARNTYVWHGSGLGEGVDPRLAVDLTWQLVDLDEKIRELEYGDPRSA